MSKLIVIIGATGGQGGSVVKSFLSDSEYRVRGITRNPDSEKSQDLKRQGVEVVKADIGDKTSLDKAFEGAYAIFAVTDYYETFFSKGKDVAMETEFQNGCNLARAASRVPTLRRYIWSTLPFTSHLSGGQAIVPHFEGKARVDQYIKDTLSDLFKKTTFAIFGIFSDNLLAYPIFKPIWLESAKKWVQFWPAPPQAPFHSLADHKVNSGVFTHAIVGNDTLEGGTYVTCIVEDLTLASALEIWGRTSGKAPAPGSTAVITIPLEQYRNLWGAMGEEQASQWVFFGHMQSLGVTSLPGVVDGRSLLSEEEKKSLETTEQSWTKIQGRL